MSSSGSPMVPVSQSTIAARRAGGSGATITLKGL